MATIAVFLSLGAVSWAAFKLPRNSVRSVNIVKGQVKRTDIGKRAVNGPRIAPGSINRSRIATNAVDSSRVADASITGSDIAPFTIGAVRIAPPETPHRIGAPGEPQFYSNGQRTWTSLAGPGSEVVFYRDQIGNVHLEGTALCTSNTNQCEEPTAGRMLTLPPGYRPAENVSFLAQSDGSLDPGVIAIYGLSSSTPGEVHVIDINTAGGTVGNISLDSIEFLAAG